MESASSPDHMSETSPADGRHSRLSFDETPARRPEVLEAASRLTGQHHQTTSPLSDGDTLISWNPLMKYVNVNLVRNVIAQHAAEMIVLSVIIIYLVYYFSRISKRPKLVGARDSKFVKMIRDNFQDPLKHRFNPLIYFWGTNPQTALFGYLQGQTSDDEVPRSKFKRQHLFVSDLQYLATNVDLSEYYEQKCEQLTAAGQLDGAQLKLKTNHRLGHFQQLDASQLLISTYNIQLTSSRQSTNNNNNNNESSLLNENIRLATSNQIEMVAAQSTKAKCATLERKESGIMLGEEDEQEDEQMARLKQFQQERASLALVEGQAASLLKSLTRTKSSDSSDSSAMGSSSDSGVFATGANSSLSGSSSHSGSSLTIDMESSDKSTQRLHKHSHHHHHHDHQRACSCVAPYELEMQSFAEQQPAQRLANSPSFEQADFLKFSAIEQQHREQIRREQLEFGQCALDWFLDSHEHYHKNKQVALISAGMTTGSDKKYVTDTVQTLDKLGYEVCVFIRRGVGGLKLSSTKFFSPSKWRDFEAAILSIHKQRPGARLVAIGFSFGSIELCRYLSMSGSESLVDSALLISCPFDPEAGGRNMRKRLLNRKIDAYLAKNLGKQLYQALAENLTTTTSESDQPADLEAATTEVGRDKSKCDMTRKQQIHINYNGSTVDLSSLPKIKSLVDFEDNYNRVIQNYPSSDAYAADSRLSELLANISTPTLCLSSEDDFMAPMKLLPIKQIEANKNVCMILTKRGGHMAFIDGLLWPKRPYFAQRIIEKYMKLDTSSMKKPEAAATATTNRAATAGWRRARNKAWT